MNLCVWEHLTLICLFSSRSLCTSICSCLHSSMIFFTSASSSEVLEALGSAGCSVLTEEAEEDTILVLSLSCCGETVGRGGGRGRRHAETRWGMRRNHKIIHEGTTSHTRRRKWKQSKHIWPAERERNRNNKCSDVKARDCCRWHVWTFDRLLDSYTFVSLLMHSRITIIYQVYKENTSIPPPAPPPWMLPLFYILMSM